MSAVVEADVRRVLRSRAGVPAARSIRAIRIHAWRAVLKIKHVPSQLFDVTFMPIMMTLLFTFMFGGALAGSTSEYIQHLAPGIMVMTTIFVTNYTGVSVNSDIKKGLHDRFQSMPNWQPAPVVGMLAGDLIRYAISGIVVITLSMLLGFRPDGGLVGVLAAAGLIGFFGVSLSWAWILLGLRARSPESVMTLSSALTFPLTFLSNVFVGTETLPTWLRPIVESNPVTHLADAARSMMAGDYASADVLWVLGASMVLTAVFAPLSMLMYRRER